MNANESIKQVAIEAKRREEMKESKELFLKMFTVKVD